MAELSSAQRAYIRKRTKVHELDPSETADELNIVPFLDIVVNLIVFLLMSLTTVAFFNQLVADLPQYGRPTGGGGPPTLNFTMYVLPTGVSLSGTNGFLRPDCQSTGTGRTVTVPIRGPGDYDWARVTECAAMIKVRFPDETRVTISLDSGIEFQHLISAMDAVRVNGADDLFPQIMLSGGVR
jgi:biopolymer transport protein TolR